MDLTFENQKMQVETKSKRYTDLFAVIICITLLLFMRDVLGVTINKYIFLLIIGVASFLLPLEKVACLIAFVMPLYVGLPGNYITLVFLARFAISAKNVRIKASSLLLCILSGGYALVQAFVTDHLSIAELMFFPGMILVTFLFAKKSCFNKDMLILCYVAGSAALGIITLIHNLQIYDIEDLLTSSTRLGAGLIDDKLIDGMLVNVDPNFYGMTAIAAISLGVQTLKNHLGNGKKIIADTILIILIVSCIVVGLFGLSRAFILILAAFILLYLLSVKNIKAFVAALIAIILLAVLVLNFMPDVWNALMNRFDGEDITTANGRTILIEEYAQEWYESITNILFGVGIFDCTVHCMPLQVLFGGGIIFTGLFAAFAFSFKEKGKNIFKRENFQNYLPLIVTAGISLTVPALTLVNAMFPIVIAALCIEGNQIQN